MNDLQVVYIDDNGSVTIIPRVLKDAKITFVKDYFSQYGVIVKEDIKAPVNKEETENAPSIGDTTQLRFMYLLFVIS